jgi:uncharacterized membrane protein
MRHMKRVKLKKWQWVFVGFLALVTAASLAVQFFVREHHETHYFWSGIPLFWIFFGIIGAWILIIFAKKIVGALVLKKEDYYHE